MAGAKSIVEEKIILHTEFAIISSVTILYCPSGFALRVATLANKRFSAMPTLAVHRVMSKISFLIVDARASGSSMPVKSKNASSQLIACNHDQT